MDAAHRNVRRLRRLRVDLERAQGPRIFRDRSNPMEGLSDEEVRKRYRFRPHTVHFICDLLSGWLQRPTGRSHSLPVLYVVLIAIQYMASGAFQLIIGDTVRVHRTTACRCIRQFSLAVQHVIADYVKFPSGLTARTTRRNLFDIAGISSPFTSPPPCLPFPPIDLPEVTEMMCQAFYI